MLFQIPAITTSKLTDFSKIVQLISFVLCNFHQFPLVLGALFHPRTYLLSFKNSFCELPFILQRSSCNIITLHKLLP